MPKDDLEQSVAPDGVKVPDDIDTSEETGNGSNSLRIKQSGGERAVDRWKNRRRLAWISLAALIIGTILLWFVVPVNRIEALQEPIVWYYISFLGIVGAYVGFASIPTGRK